MSATTPAKEPRTGEAPRRAASEELGRAFKGCMGAMRRLRGRENRCHEGLSDAQYGLLFHLREPEALPTSELAALADLSPATATGMLDGLVAHGLVTRVRSDRDRRVVLTSLTERGQDLVAARHARFAPRWEAAMSEFSDKELRTAAAVFDRLRTMFDEIKPGAEEDAPPK
jgi:DNA-binding MarR family transcriptional regulator